MLVRILRLMFIADSSACARFSEWSQAAFAVASIEGRRSRDGSNRVTRSMNSSIFLCRFLGGGFSIINALCDDVVRLVTLTDRRVLGPVGRRSALSFTLLFGQAVQRKVREVYVVDLPSQDSGQGLHGFVPLDDQFFPVS